MAMIIKLILIFAAGLIVDVLITKHTRFVVANRPCLATLFSGLITVANFALLTYIIKDGIDSGLINILAYAGGNSLGTFLAMKKVA
jgi:hypothetical protein